MNFFTHLLKALLPALAAVFFGSLLPAAPEFKYLLYNITAKTAQEVTPEGDVAAWLRSNINRGVPQTDDGSVHMLFVRDPSLEVSGYIGVYEVLQTQAEALGWSCDFSKSVASQKVYTLDFTGINPVAAHDGCRNQSLPESLPLRYPTAAEWLAYAGGLPDVSARDGLKPVNMIDGAGVPNFGLPGPADWWTFQTGSSSYAKTLPHGPIDLYGNAAEYVSDSELYYGGTNTGVLTFGSLTADNLGQTKEELFQGGNHHRGLLGARLMYIPPAEQRFKLTVTHNGNVFSSASYKAGETVTVTAPTPLPEHRFSAFPPEHADHSAPSFAYTMEAKSVTFAYTSQKYVTLKVTGGTASEPRPFLGSKVTLTAPVETDRGPFRTWKIAGTEIQGSAPEYVYTVPRYDGIQPTVPIAIAAEALYSRHPRVLIFGGTAEVAPSEAPSGKDFGDGFYRTGSVLTLTPDTLTGFTFDCWETDPTSEDRITGTYTVGAADTVVRLTARFKPAEEGGDTPAAVPSVLGAKDPAAETPEADVRFGYQYDDRKDFREITDKAGNTFAVYEPKLFGGEAPTDAYARLSFGVNAVMDDKDKDKVKVPEIPSALSYLTGKVKDGENSAFQSLTDTISALLMKRVNWTGGSKDIACYYLGVNELTVAQAQKLAERAGEPKGLNFNDTSVGMYREKGVNMISGLLPNTEPFVTHRWYGPHGKPSQDDTDSLLRYLSLNKVGGRHGMKAEIPRMQMIREAVSKGAGLDKAIVESAVVCGKPYQSPWWDYDPFGKKRSDAYGFYDLWGNVLETYENGNGRALYGGYTKQPFSACNIDSKTAINDTEPGAFRPAVPVQARRTVTVETYDGPLPVQVFPGQTLLLAPQKRSEQAFNGWTASVGKAPVLNEAGTLYEYTVTEDVTLTPTFSDLSAISLAYEGCTGTDTAYPGQTLPVYLADGETRELIDLEITPAEALERKDIAKRTFTLNATTEKVTVKAVYKEDPKPVVEPGYRLILR